MSYRPRLVSGLALLLFCTGAVAAAAGKGTFAVQREQFRVALAAATGGPEGAWKKLAIGLEDYPLYPYLEFNALKRRLPKLGRTEVQRYLTHWPDTIPAQDLRAAYLRQVASTADWADFRALWSDAISDRELVCDDLQARIAAGDKPDFAADIEPLWLTATPLPAACDPVFAWARAGRGLDDRLVWQRIDLAAAAGQAGVVGNAAALLAGGDRAAAERIAGALHDPATTLAKADIWPDTPRARDAVSFGLTRYARRDSAAAEALWSKLQSRFRYAVKQRDRVLAALALYRATSYSPDALARLKALPAGAADDATREWHVRVALAAEDWKETLAALDALTPAQQADPRWRYLRARALVKLGRKAEADPIFAALARDSGYFSFLSADWLKEPYAICPRDFVADDAAQTRLAGQPGLARAFEFYALDMLPEARREWQFAWSGLDPDERTQAADLAFRRGWYDRAVYAFSADPETQRYYDQRFPLALEPRVKRDARGAGLDPAWAYAIIRAESAWTTDARSGADAYGLMQLLPGVAKQLAAASQLAYNRPQDLFDPSLNVRLGTLYLARMAAKYDGSPWLASAAYDAGTTPLARWLDARGNLEPDFFIETIPYKETREYVARVLAFSVIYDWRLNGKVLPLAARMPRIGQPFRLPDDAARKAVVCPTATTTTTAGPAIIPPRTAGHRQNTR